MTNLHTRAFDLLSLDVLSQVLNGIQFKLAAKTPVPAPSTAWVNAEGSFLKDICTEAGLDWSMLLQGSSVPSLRLALTDELARACAESTIYPCDKVSFDRHYYLCFYPESATLHIKYQSIIGGRRLAGLNPEQVAQMRTQLIAQAREAAASPRYAEIKLRAQQVAEMVAKRHAPTKKVVALSAVEQELTLLTVRGQSIVLPEAHLAQYPAIKRLLETAGGKYKANAKLFTFSAESDVPAILADLQAGKSVTPKKDNQFFGSPAEVCDLMSDMLPSNLYRLKGLEPSAGDGALADMAKARGADMTLVESWDERANVLRSKGYNPVERDFLELTPADLGTFDFIVANPPFARGQDMDHVMHMTKFLKPGGTLCSVMSPSWKTLNQKKAIAFREYFKAMHGGVIDIPAGMFKKSGTNSAAVLVRIVMPSDSPASVDLPEQEKAEA